MTSFAKEPNKLSTGPIHAVQALHHDNRTDATQNIKFPITQPKTDPTKTMKALRFYGRKDVRVEEVPRVDITEPADAVVRVTASTVCGSDLHLYNHEMNGLEKGDILGHEAVGFVEAVGPEVTKLKVGDKVVISAVISCGKCDYCKESKFSLCDCTNPSDTMEKMYGHRLGALFGYTHLLGGYPGCQAEYVRVPFADVNLIKVSPRLTDDQILPLADIAATGYHGAELAEVKQGDRVVVFGCGPVGLMAQYWCKFRGASRVIAVDVEPYRLEVAKTKLGVEVVDGSQADVVKAVQALLPGGPDAVIDCVGFRFPQSTLHKVERLMRLETDTPELVNQAITLVRKGGRISLIGDYFSYANHFHLGAMMEKGITVRGGQLWCQRWSPLILQLIEQGKVDLTWVFTHRMTMDEMAKAYAVFDNHEDNVIKILVTTAAASNPAHMAAGNVTSGK